jgi:protein-S-isoprenylcysteine O-methyltransferase Ste14
MTKLNKHGFSYLTRILPTELAPILIFFAVTMNIKILNGWIFFGLYLLVNIINAVFLLFNNADLVNRRGENKKDVKHADHFYLFIYILFTRFLAPLMAGIEYRLSEKAYTNTCIIGFGILIILFSSFIENYAMYQNQFFERNIRIQNDRKQEVISDGPYRIIRHPGYLSYVLRFIAFPMILGKPISSIMVMVGVFVVVLRTKYEDQILKNELSGYSEYSKKVKYRLIPFIW